MLQLGSSGATNGIVGMISTSNVSKTLSYAFRNVGLIFMALAARCPPKINQCFEQLKQPLWNCMNDMFEKQNYITKWFVFVVGNICICKCKKQYES